MNEHKTFNIREITKTVKSYYLERK